MSERTPHGPAEDTAKIGADEWVARTEEHTEAASGAVGVLGRGIQRVPAAARLAAFVVVAGLFAISTDNDYFIRVATLSLLYALLVLGLNIVVGFAGLLDLGYVAFFGFGAYAYAILASEQYGLHWPTEALVPLVAIGAGLLGFLVGLPSRRLSGDYLAVVTLFFLQAFLVVATNGNSISLLGLTPTTNLTGGPNGIISVDQWDLAGVRIDTIGRHFWLALALFSLVAGAVHLLIESRTGRAWKALREDPLAAELMGMPVNRLKLLAFSLAAGIAGLAGTVQASMNVAVFPSDFDLTFLITVYAMLILGGVGSLTGSLAGAITLTVALEALRDPVQARWIFYGLGLAILLATVRPWRKLAVVATATVAFGFAVRALVRALDVGWTAGGGTANDAIGQVVQAWVVRPPDASKIGGYAFVALIAVGVGVTLLKGWWRIAGLVLTLYLAVFVWESRLVGEPSITRFLLVGALLVVLMRARPQGLLGTARVESP